MKKSIVIAILMFVICNNSNAALPTGATLFDVNVPTLSSGPIIGITGLHWETSISDYDYVLTYPPLNAFSAQTENGIYHSVNPDSRWNLKLNIGYVFPCSGNDITFTYLDYHQNTVDIVNTDTFTSLILPTLSDEWPTSGTVVVTDPFLLAPISLTVTENPNLSKARAVIDTNIYSLDYGQNINLGNRTRIKYYGGFRYARLNNDFDVIYNYSAFDPTAFVIAGVIPPLSITLNRGADFTQVVNQTSNYAGFGPHVGFDLGYYLCWGFGLTGSLSSSVLIGENSTSLNEVFTNITTATVVDSSIPSIPIGTVYIHESEEQSDFKFDNLTRVVPNIDAKIGLDYSYQYCNQSKTKVTIEAGYMVSHYFNVVERVSEVSMDAPELRAQHTLDEHFEGFYFGIQVKV